MKRKISVAVTGVIVDDLQKLMGNVLNLSKTVSMLLEDLHDRIFNTMDSDEAVENHIDWLSNYMIGIKNRNQRDIKIREDEFKMTEQLTKKELKEFIKLKKEEGNK